MYSEYKFRIRGGGGGDFLGQFKDESTASSNSQRVQIQSKFNLQRLNFEKKCLRRAPPAQSSTGSPVSGSVTKPAGSAHIYIYTNICIWIYIHCVCVCVCTSVCVCVFLSARDSSWLTLKPASPIYVCGVYITHTQTQTHTHTCIYVHIYRSIWSCLPVSGWVTNWTGPGWERRRDFQGGEPGACE
jgi:hypothetical protein